MSKEKLDEFTALAWGNSKTVLREHRQGFEYIELGEFFSAFQCLFPGILKHDKVLVRDEYRVALKALRTDRRYDTGAYVTGQPGIGKTLFFVYALVVFLGLKQPVALHVRSEYYALFRDSVTFHPSTEEGPLLACSPVWVLCDSNQYVVCPPAAFLVEPGRIRVIQATPPTASRWRAWSTQFGAECYIMDMWSNEEIVHLATLLGLDVKRTSTLAQTWGNIPRTLLRSIKFEDGALQRWYRTHADDAVSACPVVLRKGVLNDLPDGTSSSYYVLAPQKSATGVVLRDTPSIHIPTPALRRALAEALPSRTAAEKLAFYTALSGHPDTRPAADALFESWFTSHVVAGKPVHCHWLEGSSSSGGAQTDAPPPPTSLSAANAFTPSAGDAPVTGRPPYFWIAPHGHFPGIDSALVLRTGVFVFQVAVGAHFRLPSKGLEELYQRLPQGVRRLPWGVVFVGAHDERVRHVAETCRKTLVEAKTCTHVGWTAIDPASGDVPYEPRRDASDVVSIDAYDG